MGDLLINYSHFNLMRYIFLILSVGICGWIFDPFNNTKSEYPFNTASRKVKLKYFRIISLLESDLGETFEYVDASCRIISIGEKVWLLNKRFRAIRMFMLFTPKESIRIAKMLLKEKSLQKMRYFYWFVKIYQTYVSPICFTYTF